MRITQAVLSLFAGIIYSSRVGAFTITSLQQPSISSSRNGINATPTSTSLKAEASSLPTIEQLSTDPFMKQVSHAAEIVPLLSMEAKQEEGDEDAVSVMLQAQLSHSDGIRGFFVNYLTGEGDTAADALEVPAPLASAIQTVSDREDLISLASMNVIMPTAMSSMHTDAGLQQASAKTARRGIIVLKYLATLAPEEVKPTVGAILLAATDAESADPNVAYWKKFFTNYGYEEQQLKDISTAIGTIEF
jgi:hypothetical protein